MRSGRRIAQFIGVALVVAALTAGALWQLRGAGVIADDLLAEVRTVASSLETSVPDVRFGEAEQPVEPARPAPGGLGDPPEPRQRYPHIVPGKSDGVREASHTFTFEGKKHTVAVEVDEALYEGAAASDRVISAPPDETEADRNTAYYRFMVQDPEQAPLIARVAKELRAIAEREGMGKDRYAELIAKYVQTIPYDFSKLNTEDATTRFPVQTLVDGTGVCGDKSLLLAGLLAHEGYRVSLLTFERENHMAVGIKGSGDGYKDSGYLFVESTAPAYVSEIPRNFISGVKLTSDPLVIAVGTGSSEYGSASKVARILAVRDAAQEARDRLYREASQQRLTPEQAKMVNKRLRTAYEAQLRLQYVEGDEGKFLDRVPATRWIEKNAWWD